MAAANQKHTFNYTYVPTDDLVRDPIEIVKVTLFSETTINDKSEMRPGKRDDVA